MCIRADESKRTKVDVDNWGLDRNWIVVYSDDVSGSLSKDVSFSLVREFK